jgi:hypothetical protein
MRFKLSGILLILAAMVLAGCGDSSTNPAPDANANKVATDAAAKMPPPPPPAK